MKNDNSYVELREKKEIDRIIREPEELGAKNLVRRDALSLPWRQLNFSEKAPKTSRLQDITDEWVKAYLKKQRQKETAALITNTTTGGSASHQVMQRLVDSVTSSTSKMGSCRHECYKLLDQGTHVQELVKAETAAAQPDNAVKDFLHERSDGKEGDVED
jgi:hypothetical protein